MDLFIYINYIVLCEGLTFVHPRTNLSVSRLAVARNLLRRAMTLISQLENENYFNSPQDQDNISNPASNLLVYFKLYQLTKFII